MKKYLPYLNTILLLAVMVVTGAIHESSMSKVEVLESRFNEHTSNPQLHQYGFQNVDARLINLQATVDSIMIAKLKE